MRENLEHAQERQRKFEERLWQEQQNRVPEVSGSLHVLCCPWFSRQCIYHVVCN